MTALTLEVPYTEILHALDREPVRGADETSWPQAGSGQRLSVSTCERMALFQIAKHRDRDAAKALLGEQPTGTIVTDRYAVYLFIDDTQRQLRLAHLARDLVAVSERDGAPGRLGHRLSRELGRVFSVLHAPGRDPENLQALRQAIAPHRQALHDLKAHAAATPRPADSAKACSTTRSRSGRSPQPRACPPPTTPASEPSGTPCACGAPATHPNQHRQPDRETTPHPPRNMPPARPPPARLPHRRDHHRSPRPPDPAAPRRPILTDPMNGYVGWAVQYRENAQLAMALIEQAAEQQQIPPKILTLHADRGAPQRAKPVAFLLADLGITNTFAPVHLERQPLLGVQLQDAEVQARVPRPVRRHRARPRSLPHVR